MNSASLKTSAFNADTALSAVQHFSIPGKQSINQNLTHFPCSSLSVYKSHSENRIECGLEKKSYLLSGA